VRRALFIAPPLLTLTSECRHRTKFALARNACIAAVFLMTFYYLLNMRSAISVFKNFPAFQVSGNSRVCLDTADPDYFQKLARGTGVNASMPR
jgi:hypothetical protein